MPKFRIKPEYMGMIITAKPFPHQEEITLDTRTTPDEYLFNFWKFQAFRKYIDVFEDHVVLEKPKQEKQVEIQFEIEEAPEPLEIEYKAIKHEKKKRKRSTPNT